MRILIIGGTSSVAKSLIPVLSANHNVITIGRKNCDLNIDFYKPLKQSDFPNSIDVVIHTAAIFGGNLDDEIYDTEEFNSLFVLKFLSMAKILGVMHFVFISSISAIIDKQSDYYGIYSISKSHAEDLIEFYCSKFDINYTILRPSQLYGNSIDFKKNQRFLYETLEAAKNKRSISIYGTNDPLRNYLNVSDFNEIMLRVIENKVFGSYNCLNPVNVSFRKIAELANDIFQNDEDILFLEEFKDIPDNIFKFDDDLYKIIDFRPRCSLREGILSIYEQKVIR